ncbi:phage tail sheath family protein [Parapedobacter sp. DT-150]|uniref:phage tail sheath family protein n=1 Tax=Parapedobacter sp. DT-150 TaxID=3396162 RepID=UPI003F1957E7
MAQINETSIRTPGVYVNEIPLFPPSVAQVETAVPAFVGHTQLALDEFGESLTAVTPIKISSLKEYETYFGTAAKETGIAVAVVATLDTPPGETDEDAASTVDGTLDPFSNSIQSLAAVPSIANASTQTLYYNMRLYFDNGGGPCYIVSLKPVESATDAYEQGLNSLETVDEPTILVFPDAVGTLTQANYYALISQSIKQCVKLQDRFTLADIFRTGTESTNTAIANFRNNASLTDNLDYAAAYYPYLKTVYDFNYNDSDVTVSVKTQTDAEVDVKLDTLKNTHSAIYNLAKAKIAEQLSPTLPPSAAMAGIYARVDGSRGVWKAPANVGVSGVYDLTANITDEEQGGMNIDPVAGKSVNAIRKFQGKGIVVWGARTLSGNDNEWRYVSVRRLFITIEESAKKATASFVFEPNDANTWVKIRAMLENYLSLLWRQGALAGAKAEHAFYVRCGLNQTMTAQDILEGKLIVEIGLAAVRPAEFIILRFSHKMQES